MTKLQFRVLYREFLFRMVDLELLSASAKGDISKLLGQFAGLLIFLSALFAFGAILLDSHMPPDKLLVELRSMEHFLISTTMLVVGLFAVLSWDSMFPDRRDVLVLAPLPVRGRTLFLAKVAAVAASLSLTVAALHVVAGLSWPLIFATPRGGPLGVVRSFSAYWITMFSAGAFVFCGVLGLQGLAAQLPRRLFLRLSALLQMAAFCLFVSVYFLEPSLAAPECLTAVRNQRALAWLPSYWFLGLFQMLNGFDAAGVCSVGQESVDRLVDCRVRSVRSVRLVLFPHAPKDCRGARHRTRCAQLALVAAPWQLAPNRHRVVQRPHVASQPPASCHARLLFGDRVRSCDPVHEGAGCPKSASSSQRPAAIFECRHDVMFGDRNPRCVRDAARSSGQLDLPDDRSSWRQGVFSRDSAPLIRAQRGAGLDRIGCAVSRDLAVAVSLGPHRRSRALGNNSFLRLSIRFSENSFHMFLPSRQDIPEHGFPWRHGVHAAASQGC